MPDQSKNLDNLPIDKLVKPEALGNIFDSKTKDNEEAAKAVQQINLNKKGTDPKILEQQRKDASQGNSPAHDEVPHG